MTTVATTLQEGMAPTFLHLNACSNNQLFTEKWETLKQKYNKLSVMLLISQKLNRMGFFAINNFQTHVQSTVCSSCSNK